MSDKIATIENSLKDILKKMKDENLLDTFDEMNKQLIELRRDKKIEISFVGQYSAGKSSIIKALTKKDDILIGQDITTNDINSYEWGNVMITDTPGISNENIEHTETTLQHLDKSDLIVYVITVNGFDKRIKEDFIKMAFTENRVGKMMLVVNKITNEPIENMPNWKKDIQEIIGDKTLDELNVSFIDAKTYINALNEENPRRKEMYMKKSRFLDFENKLNEFISDKHATGNEITQYNVVQNYLTTVLEYMDYEIENSDSLNTILDSKKSILKSTERKLNEYFDNALISYEKNIQKMANDYVDYVQNPKNNKKLEEYNSTVEKELGKFSEQTVQQYLNNYKKIFNEMADRIGNLENSDAFEKINLNNEKIEKLKNLNRKKLNGKYIDTKSFEKVFSFLGNNISGFKTWATNGKDINKVREFTGTNIHKLILEVGHFFGKNFKPNEAVKLAEKFTGLASKFAKLGAALAVLQPLLVIMEEKQEVNQENKIQELKKEIRDIFSEILKEEMSQFNNIHNELSVEIMKKEIGSVEKEQEILIQKKQLFLSKKEEVQKLHHKVEGSLNQFN